jgi:hypothetical protein
MPITKKTKTTRIEAEKEMIGEVKELAKEIRRLKNADFLHVFKNPWKFVFYSFLKGLMMGLGSVLGATILVAMAIYLLTKVSWVPIIGDFVGDVAKQIETAQEK